MKWYNKEINEALFSQPYSRAKTISDLIRKNLAQQFQNTWMSLSKAKILSPKKEGKEMYYVNDDLIRILEG